MRRALNTLAGRLAILQLLIYAVLLPVLFSWLYAAAHLNAVNTFTRHARAYSSALARELELGDVLDSPGRTIVFLDGSVEGGGCVYAAMELNGRLLGSSATETPAWVRRRGDDLDFAKSPDDIYAVAMPFRRLDSRGTQGHEDIVELVRDTAGKCSDRGEPLLVTNLALEPCALRLFELTLLHLSAQLLGRTDQLPPHDLQIPG